MPFANDCLETVGVCPNKIPFTSIGQGAEGEIQIALRDPRSGDVIDLTLYGIGTGVVPSSSLSSSSFSSSSWSSSSSSSSSSIPKHGVEIVTKTRPEDPRPWFEKMTETPTEADAKIGLVTLVVTTQESRRVGIWTAMALIWEHGILRKLFPFYYEVIPNLAMSNYGGTITLPELRLAIRDVCPEINFLLDAKEYDEHELMWAIRRPIEYWNEIPPPVRTFSMEDFPFRYHWLEASVGELMRMVAVWMRRNDLDYSAAGLTVADTKKWPDYMKLGMERLNEYKAFVRQKKIEINIQGGFQQMGGWRTTPVR